jgi:hypothetical protein
MLELITDISAVQLYQGTSLTLTIRLLESVAAHELVLLPRLTKLNEYAPTCMALNDPPNEFAPKEMAAMTVSALQAEQGASLMMTLKPHAVVSLHKLLLLPTLILNACAPTCTALSDPP